MATNKVDRIGNKVERSGNKVDRDKLSNSRCCRFVAKTGNKVERIRQQLTLLPVSATVDFPQSRPCLNSTLSPVCTTGLNI